MPAPPFAADRETIFETMSGLARATGAVNLGQGFPDHGEPADVIAVAADALRHRSNQYPPMVGLPELRRAIADHDRRFYGLELDPEREALVTAGATGALAAAILALCGPGDEVVLIEPLYDSYLPMVRRAGATPRLVRLQPPDWKLTAEALAAACGPCTRLILVNNPQNPTGQLLDDAEMALIAEAAQLHDAIVIADEVYEHLVYDGRRFTSLMSLPGLRDRTVRIASAGKSFSLTGWKVGLVSAAPELLLAIARCHQFLTFTVPPHLQLAVAEALAWDEARFAELATRMQRKRDRLAAGLCEAGFSVLPAQGTYFLVAGFEQLAASGDDLAFCRAMVERAGVVAIPLSAFYDSEPPRGWVRFCVCKEDVVLDEAIARLKRAYG